jgi:hypothetical protein
MNKEKKHSVLSFINFAVEKMQYVINPNEKFIKWGADNLLPFQYLDLYYKVPEHTSSIDFIVSLILGEGLNNVKIDYWLAKKLVSDFIIFGGFTLQVMKTRGGDFVLSYVDISKCRFNLNKTKIGYAAEGWDRYRQEYSWYNIATNSKTEGIYIYKNVNSRDVYPTPYYNSSITSLSTMSHIADYHLNNAANGFSPSVVINFNNGIPDDATQKSIEKGIKDKFSGEKGQKFILSFNESPETKTTIQKLENDNLDQKFETLQKFVQNKIIIGHKITSPALIGIPDTAKGFSKTEFQEAMDVFTHVVINGFRKELEYVFSIILGETVKFVNEPADPNAIKTITREETLVPSVQQVTVQKNEIPLNTGGK